MNQEIKAKWVAALRGGKYKQGEGCLNDGNGGFCCLGVLCDVQGVEWVPEQGVMGISTFSDPVFPEKGTYVEVGVLPSKIRELVQLPTSTGLILDSLLTDRKGLSVALTQLNDIDKLTFNVGQELTMLTDIERELLKRARQRIKNNRSSYICYALSNEAQTPEERRAATRLRDFIENQLYPNCSLQGWQEDHGIHRSQSQRKQDRLNWIDWMLGEL